MLQNLTSRKRERRDIARKNKKKKKNMSKRREHLVLVLTRSRDRGAQNILIKSDLINGKGGAKTSCGAVLT